MFHDGRHNIFAQFIVQSPARQRTHNCHIALTEFQLKVQQIKLIIINSHNLLTVRMYVSNMAATVLY